MPVLGETTYGGATKLGTKKYGETVYGSSVETAKYGYTPSDNLKYFYDSDSRLTEIDFGTNQLSIKYEYDDAGRLTRITDVNGVQTQFEYTDRDQLYKAKTGGSIATYTYDDAGRNTRMVYPNGIHRDNTFNDRSLITQIKYTKSDSTILKFDYEYDKIGNITRKKITWKSGKITDWHYQYDNLNRLKTVTLTKNNRTTKTYYMYDKVGNRLMKDVRSTMVSMPDITPYEYNADNELLSAGDTDFEFDLNGNMVSKKEQDGDETQYVYNKMGKMIKLIKPDGSTTKYYYRHDGLRYRKIESDGDEILYYWGAGSIPPLLSERKLTHGSSTVSPLASYPPGIPCMRLFWGKQGRNFYYLTDHLGSVHYVVDEKATIINSYDYDEFGVVTSKSEGKYLGSKLYNTKGFTGEPQHQEEDGMVYLRHRYYIPELGRFSQKDPIPSINYYPYVSGNPINFTDKLGLDTYMDIWQEIIYNTPETATGLVHINNKYVKHSIRWTKGGRRWEYKPNNIDKVVSHILLSAITKFYNRKFNNPSERINKYGTITCSEWVAYFIASVNQKGSGAHDVLKPGIEELSNICENGTAELYGINEKLEIYSINPYVAKDSSGHVYVYLEFSYIYTDHNNIYTGTLYFLTETNMPDGGSYNFLLVSPPDQSFY